MDDGLGDGSAPLPLRQRRRSGRDVVIVAVGLIGGILLTMFGGDVLDRVRGADAPRTSPTPAAVSGPLQREVAVVSDAPIPADPAPTPAEAVERFLAAEVSGDHVRSFALLSAAGRATYGSPVSWRAAHADFFPVRDFDVSGVNDAGQATEVVADVRYRSTLDEVLGLVPAAAEVTWPVTREGDGWVVEFDRAEIVPRFPSDELVAVAVRRWTAARRACRPAVEYSAGLVGRASLAEALCRLDGRIAFGPVLGLTPDDSAEMVSAFGAPALTWARSVRLTGAADLTVVVAPVADEWLVVGVAGR